MNKNEHEVPESKPPTTPTPAFSAETQKIIDKLEEQLRKAKQEIERLRGMLR